MDASPTAAHALLAQTIAGVFALLALLHLYWVAGGRRGAEAAVPQLADGSPAFAPSRTMTAGVALGLLGCALLVWAQGRPDWIAQLPALRWLCRALAGVMLLRAVGDFRLVGFFKTLRDSRFARLDTRYYSPLCLFLGCACLWLAA
ncbi:DUF3995 domain-containing protein [Niveibacterium sp. SC-1]|uniref:DUF3995 domain-containing protein n=1 Tax=Niveibacterium sp. SC-1 TaxID=3135646 RepID=UPI00311E94F4